MMAVFPISEQRCVLTCPISVHAKRVHQLTVFSFVAVAPLHGVHSHAVQLYSTVGKSVKVRPRTAPCMSIWLHVNASMVSCH